MSLLATRIANLRASAPNFDKNMTRPKEFGALDLFVSQTESGNSIISPDLREKAMRSAGTNVEVPVIQFDSNVAVSNSHTCTIADDENTSALYSVVFATYSVGFTMVPDLYANNSISYEHDFQRKMEKVTRALGNALDTAAVAVLEANKSQVFKEVLYYATAANTINATWDQRTEVIGDLDVLMRANDYTGQVHIVGNYGVLNIVDKLAQRGLYNEVNKQLEYNDKVLHFTGNITNAANKFATGFAVEEGNVGMLTRHGRPNVVARKAAGHEWDIINMPGLNIPVDTHYYQSVGDVSAIAGAASADMTCDVKEHFGFSVDVAFIVAYNSAPTTQANPIIKFDVAKQAVAGS